MENFDCFVMYDVKTLEIKTLSPIPIEAMDAEHKIHKIHFKDIEPFFKNEDTANRYILDISKEYAKLVHNLWSIGNTRTIAYAEMVANKKEFLDTRSIVNDLNYRNYFFEHFCIEVRQEQDSISLALDLEADHDINSRFCMSVTEENGLTNLYVTKFKDPTVLYFKHRININDFKNNKEIRIPGCDHKVSIWAARNK
jgi:hypothetical protein